MRKSFLAGVVIACVIAGTSCAQASEWSAYFGFTWDDVTHFVSDTWEGITGWFGTESKSEQNIPDDETLPPRIASGWDKLSASLNDALTLRDKHESLPDSTWLPFTEDKVSNSVRINALLDRALAVLVNSEAGDMRRHAVELRGKLSSLSSELDEIRNRKITAPESSWLFWEMTKSKADKRIAFLEDEIRRSQAALEDINAKLAGSLREIGLELSASQIDMLLNSVTGDELLQNAIIFDNVKSVVAKLEELARNETNSFEITRHYSGMYLVLNDLLIHTQEELIRKIDGDYKPRLSEIISEADSLRKDALTRSKTTSYTQPQRTAFAQNAESNAVTIKVARLYLQLLDSQRQSTLATIKNLRLNRDLAENTYRTVKGKEDLRGLIHSGLNLFDSINSLTMPELKIFENGAMKLEFDEINRRLRK